MPTYRSWVLIAVAVTGCTSTRVLESWKADGAEPLNPATKRAVVVVAPNTERRALAEKGLAERTGATSLRAMFTPEELADRDLVRKKLGEQGFDRVIVMRVEDVAEVRVRTPPTLWTRFEMNVPPNFETFTRVAVTTSIYKVAEGEAVWEARSTSIDPMGLDGFLDDQVKASVEQLRADGLLPTAK